MKIRFFLSSFLMLCTMVMAEPLLKARSPETIGLMKNEIERYSKVLSRSGPFVRLVEISEKAFEVHNGFDLGISTNKIRDNFRITEEKGDSYWKGKGSKNFDRFAIRKTGQFYSGQILFEGRQYSLVPIKAGISVLYQVRTSKVLCGQFDSTQDARLNRSVK